MFKQRKPKNIIAYGVLLLIGSVVLPITFSRMQAGGERLPVSLYLLDKLGGKWAIFGFFFIAGVLVLRLGLKRLRWWGGE